MLRIKSPSRSNTTLDSAEDVREMTAEINVLLEKNNYTEAYLLLERLTKHQVDTPSMHVTAGMVALQLERIPAARDHFCS